MDIIYEKAVPADLDELCSVIKRACLLYTSDAADEL